MGQLCLHFEPADEWFGELFAAVKAEGFSGVGSAWFSTAELREFAAAVLAYPLPVDCPPTLAGGCGASDTQPARTTVLLRLDRHDALGALRVTVQLATEVSNGEERDLAKTTTVRFVVTYGDISEFSVALSCLLDGSTTEAVLAASST